MKKYKQLNHSEIQYLNKMVEDRLRFGSLSSFLNEMTEIIENVESGEFGTYSEAFLKIDQWVNNFKHEMRKIRSDMNNGVLRFNDPEIQERIEDILNK